MIDQECNNNQEPDNVDEDVSQEEEEMLEPVSPLSDKEDKPGKRNLQNLLLEPLPPALDPGYLEALPIVSRHPTQGDDQGGGGHQFRFHGFGKYRQNPGKRRLMDSDEESDGQWDQGVDGDGYGPNNLQKNGKKCKHRSIINYKCTNCQFKMTRFGTFFDSGSISRYLRILALSDSEECAAQLGREIDLIFECYNPTNIIQIRDHVLTVVGRSIISQVKKRNMGEHAYRVLPTEALYRDTLQYGKTYKQYLTDFREQKISVMKSQALFIDSQFESGNIEKVFKSKMGQEYHLFMNVDTNTRGHQQWFYFRVRNIKKGQPYKFNIWNFTKPKSLYREGMRLMWMSRRKAKLLGIENDEEAWECIPKENIEEKLRYFKSPFYRQKEKKGMFDRLFEEDQTDKKQVDPKKQKQATNLDQTQVGYIKNFGEQSYYCLSFSLSFDYNNDTVFIAYSRPYKYSQIILDILKNEHSLMEMEPDKFPREKMEEPARFDGDAEIVITNMFSYTRKLMCLSLSGLPVPILTVTATRNQGKKYSKREAVFITSRVHPGETNSSFVFQGILEMITKPYDPIAQSLRENYIFKLVPCLNPDGVVKGNYRSSFAGVDLNRQWVMPNEIYHPTIFHTKKELEKLYKERPILMYSDLHGHTRKRNSFIYGCNRAANGGFNSWTKVRLLPRILARLNHVFDIHGCKFKVEKGKLGTGRVVIWKEFEVTNSFTLENSFHGFDYGDNFREFQVEDFKKLGADLILSLHQYQKILIQIQKELNLTRGWLKPKRLLEVTGPTAQETLKQEQRKQAKKIKSEALQEDFQEKSLIEKPVKSFNQKPPKAGPVIKTRGGPKITLQGLIDQYVSKEAKKKEQQDKQDKQETENSNKKEVKKPLTISPKSINFKSKDKDQNLEDKKEEDGGTTINSNQSTTEQSRDKILKTQSQEPDDLQKESKEEKIVIFAIIKIQSFMRMMLAKLKYIEMQTKKQEKELQENQEELKLPADLDSAGKLTVNNYDQDSDGVRIQSEELSDLGSPCSPGSHHQSDIKKKYVNQLTLEMIESEGVVNLKDKSKPSTAIVGKRKRDDDSTSPIREHQNDDEIMDDGQYTNEREQEDDNQNDGTGNAVDWRTFFTMEELTNAFEKIQKGEEPTDEERKLPNIPEQESEEDGGSESCPSEDNLELKELYSAIYCEKNKANQYVQDLEIIEEDYKKNFANFCKVVQKKYRDASKDSNVSDTAITSEVRLQEKPGVTKKASDILLSNQKHQEGASDTTSQVPSVKTKKLKIIIPKKKIREKSNEPTDDEKPKTKRKEKSFIINITKKNANQSSNDNNNNNNKNNFSFINKNQTLVIKKNTAASEAIKKALAKNDRRLKSQEANKEEKGARPKLQPNPAFPTPTQTPTKPLVVVKHISRVTGLNRSQQNKSFLPILKSKPVEAEEKKSENTEGQDGERATSNELRVSESGKSPSELESGTKLGITNIEHINRTIKPNQATTQYSNGFGIDDIIQEESMDRATPLGVEPYNTRMAATQNSQGFITDKRISINLNNQINRHPTQQQIINSRGQKMSTNITNDRYGIASFNQPHALYNRNYSSQYGPGPQPTPANPTQGMTALQKMEQELLRQNQESVNKQPPLPHPTDERKTTVLGQGLINAIRNQGQLNNNQNPLGQSLRMPVHGSGIKGQGMLNFQPPSKVLSKSPEVIQQLIKMSVQTKQPFGANMVNGGITGSGVDQRTPQNIIRSPQPTVVLNNAQRLQVLNQVNQSQKLSGQLKLKIQQQQQLSTNPQMGLLRTPRRLVQQNNPSGPAQSQNFSGSTTQNFIGSPPNFPGSPQNFSGSQQAHPLIQNNNPYSQSAAQSTSMHAVTTPQQRANLGQMQQLHFQKQYQQFRRN